MATNSVANLSISWSSNPMTTINTKSQSLLSNYNSLKPYFNSSLNPFKTLSFHSSISTPHFSTRRPISATVLSSLPTANPDRFASADKVPKWSLRAIKSFALAALEARKLKSANTGTEALILGILVEGTSVAAKYLWTNGVTVLKVREEIVKLLGKPDFYFFPPEQPPLTESAQRALDWAVDHKLKSGGDGEITTSDILLGVWSEVDSPGHKVLAALGFNDEKAKELESLTSGPGFVDG